MASVIQEETLRSSLPAAVYRISTSLSRDTFKSYLIAISFHTHDGEYVSMKQTILCLLKYSVLFVIAISATVQAEEFSTSAIDARLEMESKVEDNGFAILPHKPNYILPFSYNSRPNHAPWTGFGVGKTPVQNSEIKFQISVKVPLAHNLFSDNDGVYVAYTQKSFWQAYNKTISSPFRDTNFNPEIFYRIALDESVAGMNIRLLSLGFEHESNGRAEPLSRSWNRIYGTIAAERGHLTMGAKLWYRIPESASSDNNPDITNFLGHGELYAYYHSGEQTFGLMFRPGLSAGFTPGIQLDWSFPLTGKLKGYVQYYSGYGESLIDYNHYNNTIGIGVMLTNWL